ncbi:hypothetical protein [Pseudomonas sp. HY13-MNA-CIBAN-0226]|uniref:hypothetical protein n=1 Tax=Pseudomonas sp. HY13-MNA-CIBAN-0226 TaxID=3140473 RepID=UPI003321ACF5
MKRYSDFDLLRIAQAVSQDYEGLITAFLVSVHIHACSAVGVVFGHICPGPHQRFSDGRLIRTSDIQSVVKEGRFWVINTVNSKYVIATFQRDVGRRSLRDFMRIAGGRYVPTPSQLQ